MKSPVNYFELFLYYCIWTTAILLTSFKFIEAQNEIFTSEPRFSSIDLVPGWHFIGREKDASDIEWGCFKYFIKTSWFYLIFQFFISESLRKINSKMVKYWYLISSLIFIFLKLGAKELLLLLAQPSIYYVILVCGGKRIVIWTMSIFLLFCYDKLKNAPYWDDIDLQDNDIFLLMIALGWTELRCISFSIDYIEYNEKGNTENKGSEDLSLFQCFINMFSYVFYMPVLYCGPIMLYKNFENSFDAKIDDLQLRMKRFFCDLLIFGIYSFLLEIALHYIYFCAMYEDVKYIEKLSSVALVGAGLWMGFQFYIKYVISYGTTAAFARLDNMEAPPTPRCIARIHVYSLMWRYFDVGLYQFLVKYIYKPVYGAISKRKKMSKTSYKLLASLCTFLFIFMWHGLALNILIWSILNYCGILLEHIAKAMATTESYKKFKTNVLKTDAMESRLIAALSAPLLAVSAVSNFYMFGGTEVGHLYVALLNKPALHNLMLAMLSTYCCAHVSMSLLDVTVRTDIKRERVKAE